MPTGSARCPGRLASGLRAGLPPSLAVDEIWLPIGDDHRPGGGPRPKGERLGLRLSGSGLDGGSWLQPPGQRGAGMMTDDNPIHGLALKAMGLDQRSCAVPRQCTVGRHLRCMD